MLFVIFVFYAVTAVLISLAVTWRIAPDPLVRSLLWLERKRSGLHQDYQNAAGIRFRYLYNAPHPHKAGDDTRPVLVLLHGFGGDVNHWLRLAPYLTGEYRLIIPDLPGFGDTPFPEPDSSGKGAPGNMAAQAERVMAFLDALGIQEFTVAGNSMGAYLAAVVAEKYPQRVNMLWMMNPGGVHRAELTEVLQLIADGGPNWLIPEDIAAFNRLRERVFIRQPLLPKPVARSIVRRCLARKGLFTRLFEELAFDSEPLDDLAARISCPTLLIWGDQDQILHPSACAILAQELPDCHSIMMENMGHCPMLESPDVCARDFQAFVKSRHGALTLTKAAVHH